MDKENEVKSSDLLIPKTAAQGEEKPEELTLKTAATLLACGIDPEKSTLFV